MSIGTSGRIVIEVEPELKRLLYASLATDASSLKDWFIERAEAYLKAKATERSDQIGLEHQQY